MNKQIQETASGKKKAKQPMGCRGQIFLILFGIVSALVIGEVYGRVTPAYATPEQLRRRSLEYEASLFARHMFPDSEQEKPQFREVEITYTINERGYRGDNFEVPKPANIIRIVVLGGSAAFDIHADQDEDWPTLAEQLIHEQGFTNVEIINAGAPGHATWDSLGRFYAEIWTFEPDYVVVYHGWNDLKYFDDLSADQTLLREFSPAKTISNDPKSDDPIDARVWNPHIYYAGPIDQLLSHSQFYLRFRQAYLTWKYDRGLEGAATEVAKTESEYPNTYGSVGPDQFALNLRLIVDTARNIDATPLFITQARLPTADSDAAAKDMIRYDFAKLSHVGLVAAFAEIDEIIAEVGEEKETAVLDLSPLNGQSDLFSDHVHTTPAGSQAIAEAFATFLIEQLEQQ
ncbi:MAG: hypothetical protein GY943_10840 [Chloroflexi bacterium]|nr:hypothetical protein [Chloroflexota bacterium]